MNLLPAFQPVTASLNEEVNWGGAGGERPEIGIVPNDHAAYLGGQTALRDGILRVAYETEVPPKVSPAHKPNVYWLPWILTDDPLFIERMESVPINPAHVSSLSAFNVPRRHAWNLRDLAQLAYLERQGMAEGEGYRALLDGARLAAEDQTQDPYLARFSILGAQKNLGPLQYKPWQLAFQGMALAHVVRLGFPEWLPILEYQFQNLPKRIATFGLRGCDTYSVFIDGDDERAFLDDSDVAEFNRLPRDELIDPKHPRPSGGTFVHWSWAANQYAWAASAAEFSVSNARETADAIYAALQLRNGPRWYAKTAIKLDGQAMPEEPEEPEEPEVPDVIIDDETPAGEYPVTDNGNRVGTLTLSQTLGAGSYNVVAPSPPPNPVPDDPPAPDPDPPAPGAWPAWRAAIPAGSIAPIPCANLLASLDPHLDPAIAPQFPSTREPWGEFEVAIFQSWSGGVMAPDGVFYIPLHGGHTNGAGNQPYRLNLMSDAPAWEMLRPPSGSLPDAINLNDGQEATGLYADGRIRAAHAYNSWCWTPDGLLNADHSGSYKTAVGGTDGMVLVSPETGEATYIGPPWANNIKAGSSIYDPSRSCVWSKAGKKTPIVKIDLATRTADRVGGWWSTQNYGSIHRIAVHDVIVGIYRDPGLASIQLFDCETGDRALVPLSGDVSALESRCAFRIQEMHGSLWLWDNTPGQEEYVTRIPIPANPWAGPWVAEKAAFVGDAPTSPRYGTYGMFQAVPELGGFFLATSTFSHPVFFAVD